MTRQTSLQFFVLFGLAAAIGYALDRNVTGAEPRRAGEEASSVVNEFAGEDSSQFRLREGMKFVNRVGELREHGGSIKFYPDGDSHSFQLLENLALERVSRDVDQSRRKWSVTGIITEYRNSNYLLLQRAVRKARISSAPGPRS